MIRKVDCGSTSGGKAGVKANTSRRRRKEQVPDSKSVIRPLLHTLTYEHSDEIALAIYRDISDTLECNRESEEYIERIRRELYMLCNYNRALTLSEKKFPRLESLRNVLARYVDLECAVLYSKTNPNNRSAREGEVEKRVQSFLYMMLYSIDQQHLVDYRLLHKSVLFVLQHVNKRYCAEGRLAHRLTIHVLQKYGKFDAIIKIKDSRQDFLIQHLRNNDPDIAFLSIDPYEDVKDFERNVFFKIPDVSEHNAFDPNVFVKSKCKHEKIKAIKNEGVKRRGVVLTIDLTDEAQWDEEDKSEGACSIWKRDAFRKSPDLSSKDLPNRSSVQTAAVKSTNYLSASSRSRADDDIIIISDGGNEGGGGGGPVPSVEANFIDLTSDGEQEAHEVEEETVAQKETGEDPVAVNQVNEIASAPPRDPPPINQVNEISNNEPANAFHVFPRIRCLTINQVNEVSSSVISECDEVSRNEEVPANDGNVSSTGNSPSRNTVPYFNGEISSTTGKLEENALVELVYRKQPDFADCNFENSPSQSGTVYSKKFEAEKDCGISSPTDELVENREPVKVQSIQPPQPNELVINIDDEDSEGRKDDAEKSTNDPCSSKQAQGHLQTPNSGNNLDDERETSAASCCNNERVEEHISQSVQITKCNGHQGNVQSTEPISEDQSTPTTEKVEELKRRENDVLDENSTNLLSTENSPITEHEPIINKIEGADVHSLPESPKQADEAVQLKSCDVDAMINHSQHNDDALEDISNSLEALINAGIDDESSSLKKPLSDANEFQVDEPSAFEEAQFSDIIVTEYMELVSSVDDYETQITNHSVEGAQVAQSGNLVNELELGKKRIETENSNYQKVLEADEMRNDNLQLGDSPTEDTELNLETVEIEDNNLQVGDPPAKNTERNENTVSNADLPMKQSDMNVDCNEPKRNTLEPVVEDHAQLNLPDVNTGDALELGDSPFVEISEPISENCSADNIVSIHEEQPDEEMFILTEMEQILGESPKEQLQNDDVVIQEDTSVQNQDDEPLLHVINSELGNSPSEDPELFVQEEPPACDEKIICESLRNAGGLELGDLPAGFKSDLSNEQATHDANHDEINSETPESDQCVIINTNIDLELNEFKSSDEKQTERDFEDSPEQKSGLELGDLPAGLKSDLSNEQATHDANHDKINSETPESDQCVIINTNIDLELNEFKSSNDKKTERDFEDSPEQKSIEPFTGNKEQSEAQVNVEVNEKTRCENDSHANHFEPLLTECTQRREGDLTTPSDFEGNFEPPKDTSQCGDSLADNFKTDNSHAKADIECSPLQHGSDDVVPCPEHFSETNEHYTVTENASAENPDIDISDIEVTVNDDNKDKVSETNELIAQCEDQIIHNEQGNTVLSVAKENPDDFAIENIEEDKQAEINEVAVNNIEKPPTTISVESSVSTDKSSVTETNENAGVINEQLIEIVQTSSDSIVPADTAEVIENTNAFNDKGPPIKIVQSLESPVSANIAEVIENTNAFDDKGPPIKIVQSLESPVPGNTAEVIENTNAFDDKGPPIKIVQNLESLVSANTAEVIENTNAFNDKGAPIKIVQSLESLVSANTAEVIENTNAFNDKGPPIKIVQSLESHVSANTAEVIENTNAFNDKGPPIKILQSLESPGSANRNVDVISNTVETNLDSSISTDENFETKINENADVISNELPIKTLQSDLDIPALTHTNFDVTEKRPIETVQTRLDSLVSIQGNFTAETSENTDVINRDSQIKTARADLDSSASTNGNFEDSNNTNEEELPITAIQTSLDATVFTDSNETKPSLNSSVSTSNTAAEINENADVVHNTEEPPIKTDSSGSSNRNETNEDANVINEQPIKALQSSDSSISTNEKFANADVEKSPIKSAQTNLAPPVSTDHKFAVRVEPFVIDEKQAANVLECYKNSRTFFALNVVERHDYKPDDELVYASERQVSETPKKNVPELSVLIYNPDVNKNPLNLLATAAGTRPNLEVSPSSKKPERSRVKMGGNKSCSKAKRQRSPKAASNVKTRTTPPRAAKNNAALNYCDRNKRFSMRNWIERSVRSSKVDEIVEQPPPQSTYNTDFNVANDESDDSFDGLVIAEDVDPLENESPVDILDENTVDNELVMVRSESAVQISIPETEEFDYQILNDLEKLERQKEQEQVCKNLYDPRVLRPDEKECASKKVKTTDHSIQTILNISPSRSGFGLYTERDSALDLSVENSVLHEKSKPNLVPCNIFTDDGEILTLEYINKENAATLEHKAESLVKIQRKTKAEVKEYPFVSLSRNEVTDYISSQSVPPVKSPTTRKRNVRSSGKVKKLKKTRRRAAAKDNSKKNRRGRGVKKTKLLSLEPPLQVLDDENAKEETERNKFMKQKPGKKESSVNNQAESESTTTETICSKSLLTTDLPVGRDSAKKSVKAERNKKTRNNRKEEDNFKVNVANGEEETNTVALCLTRLKRNGKDVVKSMDNQEKDEPEVKLKKRGRRKTTEGKGSEHERDEVEVNPEENETAKSTRNIKRQKSVDSNTMEDERSEQERDEAEVKVKKNEMVKHTRNAERKRSVNEKVEVEVKLKKNEMTKNTEDQKSVGDKVAEVKSSERETDEIEVKFEKDNMAKNSRNTERKRSVNDNIPEEKVQVEVKPRKNEMTKNIKNTEEQTLIGGKAAEVKRSKQETDEIEVKLKKNGMTKNSRYTERKRSVNLNATEEEQEKVGVEVKPKKNELAKNTRNIEEQISVGGKPAEVKRSKQETDETEVKLKKNDVGKNRRNTERKKSVNGNTMEGKGFGQEKVQVEVKQKINELAKNTKNIEEQMTVGDKAVEVKRSEQEADETEVKLKKNDTIKNSRNTERKRSVNGITVEGEGCEQEKVEIEVKPKKNETTENSKNTAEQKSVGGKPVEVKRSKQETDETEVKLTKNSRNAERRSVNGNTTEGKACEQEKVEVEVKPKINEMAKSTEEQKLIDGKAAEVKRSEQETDETDMKPKKNDKAKNSRNTRRKRSVIGNITEEKGCEQEKVEVEVKPKKNETTENSKSTEEQKSVGDKAVEVKISEQETDETEVKLKKNDMIKNSRKTERKRSVNCNTTEEKVREQEKVEVEVKPKKNELTKNTKSTDEQKSVGGKAVEVKKSKQEIDETEVKLKENDMVRNSRNTERKSSVNENTTEENGCEQEIDEVEVKAERIELEVGEVKSKRNEIIKKAVVESDTEDDEVLRPKKNDVIKSHRKSLESKRNKLELAEAKPKRNESIKNSKHNVVEAELKSIGKPAESKRNECEVKTKRNDFTKREKRKKMDTSESLQEMDEVILAKETEETETKSTKQENSEKQKTVEVNGDEQENEQEVKSKRTEESNAEESREGERESEKETEKFEKVKAGKNEVIRKRRKTVDGNGNQTEIKSEDVRCEKQKKLDNKENGKDEETNKLKKSNKIKNSKRNEQTVKSKEIDEGAKKMASEKLNDEVVKCSKRNGHEKDLPSSMHELAKKEVEKLEVRLEKNELIKDKKKSEQEVTSMTEPKKKNEIELEIVEMKESEEEIAAIKQAGKLETEIKDNCEEPPTSTNESENKNEIAKNTDGLTVVKSLSSMNVPEKKNEIRVETAESKENEKEITSVKQAEELEIKYKTNSETEQEKEPEKKPEIAKITNGFNLEENKEKGQEESEVITAKGIEQLAEKDIKIIETHKSMNNKRNTHEGTKSCKSQENRGNKRKKVEVPPTVNETKRNENSENIAHKDEEINNAQETCAEHVTVADDVKNTKDCKEECEETSPKKLLEDAATEVINGDGTRTADLQVAYEQELKPEENEQAICIMAEPQELLQVAKIVENDKMESNETKTLDVKVLENKEDSLKTNDVNIEETESRDPDENRGVSLLVTQKETLVMINVDDVNENIKDNKINEGEAASTKRKDELSIVELEDVNAVKDLRKCNENVEAAKPINTENSETPASEPENDVSKIETAPPLNQITATNEVVNNKRKLLAEQPVNESSKKLKLCIERLKQSLGDKLRVAETEKKDVKKARVKRTKHKLNKIEDIISNLRKKETHKNESSQKTAEPNGKADCVATPDVLSDELPQKTAETNEKSDDVVSDLKQCESGESLHKLTPDGPVNAIDQTVRQSPSDGVVEDSNETKNEATLLVEGTAMVVVKERDGDVISHNLTLDEPLIDTVAKQADDNIDCFNQSSKHTESLNELPIDGVVKLDANVMETTVIDNVTKQDDNNTVCFRQSSPHHSPLHTATNTIESLDELPLEGAVSLVANTLETSAVNTVTEQGDNNVTCFNQKSPRHYPVHVLESDVQSFDELPPDGVINSDGNVMEIDMVTKERPSLYSPLHVAASDTESFDDQMSAGDADANAMETNTNMDLVNDASEITVNTNLATDELPLDGAVKQRNLDEPPDNLKDVVMKEEILCPSSETPLDCVTSLHQGNGLEDSSCEALLDDASVAKQGDLPFSVEQKGTNDPNNVAAIDGAFVMQQSDLHHLHKPSPDGAFASEQGNDVLYCNNSTYNAVVEGACVVEQNDEEASPHHHEQSPDGAFSKEQKASDVTYDHTNKDSPQKSACDEEKNSTKSFYEPLLHDSVYPLVHTSMDPVGNKVLHHSEIFPLGDVSDRIGNTTEQKMEEILTHDGSLPTEAAGNTTEQKMEEILTRDGSLPTEAAGNTTEQKMEEILTHDGSLPTEAAGNTTEQKMEIALPVAENVIKGGEENETVENNLQPESTAILDGVGKLPDTEESMEVRKFIAVSNDALDVDDYYKALRDVLRNNNQKNLSSESHLHTEPEKSAASPSTENSNGDDNSNGEVEVKESALACNLLDCSATEEKDPAFSLYTQEEINDNSIVNPPSLYVEAKKKFDAKLIAATSNSATQKITSIYTPEEINGCTVHPKKMDPLNPLENNRKLLLPLPHVSALLRSAKEVFIGASSKQTSGCAYVDNFMDLPPHVKLERSNVESNSFCASNTSDDNDKSDFLHYNQKPPGDFFEQEAKQYKTSGNIDNICMDGLNFLPHNMLHSDPIPMWRLGEVISENVDILTSNSNSMCEKQEYDDGIREERGNPGENANPEDFWSEQEKENCGEKVQGSHLQAFDNPIREENVAANRIDVNEIPSRKTLKPSGMIHIILEPSEHNYCIGGPLLNAKPENNALKQVDGGNLCKMKGNEQVSDNSPVDGEHIFHFSEQIASLVKNNLTTLSMEDSPVDENNDDQDEQKIFSLIENSNSFSFSQPTVMSVEKMNDVMMAIANLNSLTSVQQNKKLDKQKVDFLFQQEDSISSNDSTVSNDIHSDCDFAINSIAMLRTQNTNMSDSVDDSDFTPGTSDEFTPPEENATINVIVKHNHSDFASMDSIFSGNDFDIAQSKTTTENNMQPQANTADVLVKQSNDTSKNDGKKRKPERVAKHKADVFIKQTNGKASEAKLSTNILDDMLVKAMQRQNTRTRVLAAQKKVHKEKNEETTCQTVTVINKIQTPSSQPPVLIPKREITSDDKFPVIENEEPPVLTPEIHFAKFKPHEDDASKEMNSSPKTTGARSKGELISQKPREDMIDSIKRRQRRPPEKYMDSVLLKVEKETQEEKFKVFEKNKIKSAIPVVKTAKEKKPKKRAADDESSNDSSMSVKVRAKLIYECGDFDENASSDEFYRNKRPNCKKLMTSELSDGSASDNDLDIKICKERRMTSEEMSALFDKVRDGKDGEDGLEQQQKKTKPQQEAGVVVQKQVRFNLQPAKPSADAKPARHRQYKNACGPNVPTTKGYYASGGHPQSRSHPDYRDRYTRGPAGGSQSSRYPSYPSQTGEQIYRSRSRSPLMKFGNSSERRTGFQDYRVYANSRTTPYNGSRVHSGRRNVDLPTLLSHYSQIHRANNSSREWSENVSGIGTPLPNVSFQAPSSEYFPPPP